jgi:hypothetical protein
VTISLSKPSLKEAEALLAQSRPFGDWEYIEDCLWERYRHRLASLTEVPAAARLLHQMDRPRNADRSRILGDPLVRGAINSLLGHHKLHIAQPHLEMADLEAVLDIAAQALEANQTIPPLAVGALHSHRLGAQPHHGWIWWNERSEDVVGKCFDNNLHKILPLLHRHSPDALTSQMLVEGTALLEVLLPKLGPSALGHGRLIIISTLGNEPIPFDYSTVPWFISLVEHYSPWFTSLTHVNILGAIFLAPSVLRNPWQAAEFLLHEALHHKFMDLEHTHTMMRSGYKELQAPKTIVPWNRDQEGMHNIWAVNRAMTVLHVYVGLAIFFMAVRDRGEPLIARFGPLHVKDLDSTIRNALDRAFWLGHFLKANQQEMGSAGIAFVDLLIEVAESLGTPMPAGSTAHLLLDLYGREIPEVEEVLIAAQNLPHPPVDRVPPAQIVEEMAQSEMNYFMRITGQSLPPSEPLAPDVVEPAAIVARLRSVRQQILAVLLPLARSRHFQSTALVQAMVETSGLQINRLASRLAQH